MNRSHHGIFWPSEVMSIAAWEAQDQRNMILPLHLSTLTDGPMTMNGQPDWKSIPAEAAPSTLCPASGL